MKNRRWIVAGVLVLSLAGLFFGYRYSASRPPFRFIHGSLFRTVVRTEPYILPDWGARGVPVYGDYYVFRGDADAVGREATEELSSAGYRPRGGGLFMDGLSDVWFDGAGETAIVIERLSESGHWPASVDLWPAHPQNWVMVTIHRTKPNLIERIQEWAHARGL